MQTVSPPSRTTSYTKLCSAISILQNKVLADDSTCSGEAVFGTNYMPSLGIEHAIALLTEVLERLESSGEKPN